MAREQQSKESHIHEQEHEDIFLMVLFALLLDLTLVGLGMLILELYVH